MSSTKRTRAILTHLESARADIENSIDQSQSRKHWRILAHSVLVHWLGAAFDEGSGYLSDLETSINISKEHVTKLTDINSTLKLRIAELEARLGK